MRKKNLIFFLLAIVLTQINCGKSSNQPPVPAPTSQIPVLTATVFISVTTNSAVCGGNITSTGSSPVTSRGICYSAIHTPTILDAKEEAGTGTGVFTATLTGLVNNTIYYFRPYATNNSGTAYGSLGNFTTLQVHSIGENYAGGQIFYIDPSGQHGMIAAPNLGLSGSWGCPPIILNGANETAVGTGYANTLFIAMTCPNNIHAATICNDLVVNGYSDWYLPSKDELNLLYLQRNIIGGLGTISFWSSSQASGLYAWSQNFSDGSQNNTDKSFFQEIRPIRSF